MRSSIGRAPFLIGFGVLLALLLILSLACASAESTATPVKQAQPAPAIAPTSAPVATATSTPAQASATSTSALPTPTRALPTATPAAASKVQYGGTLRVSHTFGAIKTMDPHFDLEATNYRVMWTLYNNIVKRDPNFGMVPDLAQSWEVSADAKSITFKLNPGIKFQDGTELNAQAVKWNLDFVLNPENSSAQRSDLAQGVQSVDVVDDLTFRINSPKPFRPLLATLSDRAGWIASPTAKQKFGKDFGRNPTGSGPFKLKEWIPGGDILVVKSDTYWEKGLPYLDAIKFQTVFDASVRIAMLRTDETDFIEEMRNTDVPLIKANSNLRIAGGASGRVWMLITHVNEAPFNNLALRQAMSYALDRKAILDIWFEGMGQEAYLEGVPTGWWFFPDIKPYSYDLQKAKTKMVEAGYPNGVNLNMDCDQSISYIQLCEMIQAQMAQAGITLKIVPRPSANYWADFTPGKGTQQFGPSWRGPRPDPHINIQRVYHSKGNSNMSGYSNPQVDKLIDDAVTVFDVEKAKSMYREIQKTVTENVTELPIVYPDSYVAMNKRVQNYILIPDFMTKFREIWVSK